MKKIDIILCFFILVIVILIGVKISKQEVVLEKNNSLSDEIKNQIEYEANRMARYDETGLYSKFADDGKRINISQEMKKELVFDDGLESEGFSLEYKDGYTYVYAIVNNDSIEVKGGYSIQLDLINDKEEVVNSFSSYLNKIEPGDSGIISTSIPGDVTDAYRFEIRKIEEAN